MNVSHRNPHARLLRAASSKFVGAQFNWSLPGSHYSRRTTTAHLRNGLIRHISLCVLALVFAWTLLVVFLLACGADLKDSSIPVARWRFESHAQPRHQLIVSWADDVRAITSKPLQQVAVAEQVIWHQVRYWDAYEIWGSNCYVPDVDEMVTRAQEKNWNSLRGNCVSQSIALHSLLLSLGFESHIRSTPSHAWVECIISEQKIDLLYADANITNANAYLPQTPLHGNSLLAAQRLGADLNGVFKPVGLLTETDEPIPYFAHPIAFLLYIPLFVFWFFVFRRWDRIQQMPHMELGRAFPLRPNRRLFHHRLQDRRAERTPIMAATANAPD